MFRQTSMAIKVAQELSSKFDVLTAKLEDHDKRIAELECENREKNSKIATLKKRVHKEYKYDVIKITGFLRRARFH